MLDLASRADRLKGALVDTFLYAVPYYLLKKQPGGPVGGRLGAFLFFALLCAQLWLLGRDGQTLGKRAARTRIVLAKTGERAGFLRAAVLRYLLNGTLIRWVPLYWLLDALLVFRPDRRCVHDWIAGTKVVSLAKSGEGE